MTATSATITEALKSVKGPDGKDIVSSGKLSGVVVTGGKVFCSLTVDAAEAQAWESVRKHAEEVIKATPGVASVLIALTAEKRPGAPSAAPQAASQGGPGGQPAAKAAPGVPGVKAIIAVASGKGGVGKSTTAVNLATALAERGLTVGVLDADIYGHSVPRMLGSDAKPTQVERMIMPPSNHGVRFISIGQFTDGNTPVTWRGPMLHRALQQFLADVYWGDLDVLLLDLPPGTGDVAISIAQLIPGAEILVVTTPQQAAAEVAERAGAIALQTRQKILGVVENMSWLELPDGSRMEPFGSGGGEQVAQRLTRAVGAQVDLLGQVPLETALREGGDAGVPVVLSAPESASGSALRAIAGKLAARKRGLAGMSLGLDTIRNS